ncbi:hypothetical protein BJV74DRAFT_398729 [Russula compacta]|nr:hypothetical protein BJV74DRAFT_398729 [Russula compacta]
MIRVPDTCTRGLGCGCTISVGGLSFAARIHAYLWIFGSGVRQDDRLSLTVQHASLKMPGVSSLQGSQHTLRLASACVFKDARVALMRHLLCWLIRPTLAFGRLSSRGPLGLALSFYRALVRCLNIAHFNFKSELGATNYSRNILPLGFKLSSRVSGDGGTRGEDENVLPLLSPVAPCLPSPAPRLLSPIAPCLPSPAPGRSCPHPSSMLSTCAP